MSFNLSGISVMRNLFLFLIPFLFFCCSDIKSKHDCNRFKEGKFLLKSRIGDYNYLISRKGNKQTELNQQSDTLTGADINWLGECEYEVIPIYKIPDYSDTNNKRAIIESLIIKSVKIRIISTGDNYYVFEAKRDGINKSYSDTMWILK